MTNFDQPVYEFRKKLGFMNAPELISKFNEQRPGLVKFNRFIKMQLNSNFIAYEFHKTDSADGFFRILLSSKVKYMKINSYIIKALELYGFKITLNGKHEDSTNKTIYADIPFHELTEELAYLVHNHCKD